MIAPLIFCLKTKSANRSVGLT